MKLPRFVEIASVFTRPDCVCDVTVTPRALPGPPPGTAVYVARYFASAASSVGPSITRVQRKRGDRSQ